MNTLDNNTYQKTTGDTLSAETWNGVINKVNELVDHANLTPSGSGEGLPNMYINSKGNLNIETSEAIGNTSKGKINIESMDDIQLKPGDDIILYSHHRAQDKQDEVAIKVTDGEDIPVKLQLNAAEMTITTKDKQGDNSSVFDVNINSGKNTKGYLKVRAQAIDLRCEEHGGIALQPKGEDGEGHENKIKFEHGGGDGLEFATFNTEKTSVFTDEYRFNKDGIWKMASRDKIVSDKFDNSDPTTQWKYRKQADDFYDIISPSDEVATTKDIIKTAYALNGNHNIYTKITSQGDLEIASEQKYTLEFNETPDQWDYEYTGQLTPANLHKVSSLPEAGNVGPIYRNLADILENIKIEPETDSYQYGPFASTEENTNEEPNQSEVDETEEVPTRGIVPVQPDHLEELLSVMKEGEVAKFTLSSTDPILNSSVVVLYVYKCELSNINIKSDGKIKLDGQLCIDGTITATTPTNETVSASMVDIIKLTNYMKDNNQVPLAL